MFNALYAVGLKVETHFKLGIATLDGTKTVSDMTGVTYVQYTDHNELYDESVVYDDAWKKVPATVVPPKPPVVSVRGVLVTGLDSKVVASVDGGVTWR